MKHKQPFPPEILNKPEMTLGLELFWQAFSDLTSCRSMGQCEGPISWLSMHQYCEANDIFGELKDDLIYMVSRMDDTYLQYKSEVLEASCKF